MEEKLEDKLDSISTSWILIAKKSLSSTLWKQTTMVILDSTGKDSTTLSIDSKWRDIQTEIHYAWDLVHKLILIEAQAPYELIDHQIYTQNVSDYSKKQNLFKNLIYIFAIHT